MNHRNAGAGGYAPLKAALLGSTALAILAGAPAAAVADETRERNLEQRVEQLERELRTLRNRERRRAAEASDEASTVTSGGDRVSVSVSGQVNRAFVAAFHDTGGAVDLLNVDNDNSSSRLRVDGAARIDEDWRIDTRIEFDFQDNASDDVNTANDGGDANDLGIRHARIRFIHDRWGRLIVGHTDTGANGVAEVDLSGTSVVAKSDVKSTFGGIAHQRAGGLPAFARIGGAALTGDALHDNLDGNSRENTLRYDTPRFFDMVHFQVSFDEDNAVSGSAWFRWDPEGWRVRAAFGMVHLPTGVAATGARVAGNGNIYAGSASVLHRGTGLSFTVAGGTMVSLTGGLADTPNPWYLYMKLGYETEWFEMGNTAFSIDWIRSDNFVGATAAGSGSHSQSIRFAVVQDIDRAGTELYFAYGWQDAYVPGFRLGAFHAIMMGARVKF